VAATTGALIVFRFAPPSEDEVSDAAKALGIAFTGDETAIFGRRVGQLLEFLDTFDDMDLQPDKPPVKYSRGLGAWRPSRDEDPLNAFIHKCHLRGAAEGPLKGKTVGLKDHIAVAGIPSTLGCRMFENYVPDHDATVVTRLLDAGATIVGKLNMEPFSLVGAGLGGVSDYGRVLNPADYERVTGGSSSGSAAAAAAGQIDIALGGDQGGSIRVPSAFCGIVGLKPTFGLVPHTGVIGLEPTFDHVGPMARTVADVAVALECIAGRDEYDSRQHDVPEQASPRFTQSLGDGVAGVRVGVLREGFTSESPVDLAVREGLHALAKVGAKLEDVSIPQHARAGLVSFAAFVPGMRRTLLDSNLGGLYANFYPTDFISYVYRLRDAGLWELPPFVKLLMLVGSFGDRRYQGTLYAKANNARRATTRLYDDAFKQVDVLAMPTVGTTAWTYTTPDSYRAALERSLLANEDAGNVESPSPTPNTGVFDFTGHPALSVPCGLVDGLPVGLQLVGPHFSESRLLRVAAAIEGMGLSPT
jgi:amidase